MVPGPDLLRPRSGEDDHVGSGTQFPSSTRCNHLFGVYDPYGIHNTWLSLSSLGSSSSGFVSPDLMLRLHLKKFLCCVSRMTCDIKAVKGVNYRGGYRCCSSG